MNKITIEESVRRVEYSERLHRQIEELTDKVLQLSLDRKILFNSIDRRNTIISIQKKALTQIEEWCKSYSPDESVQVQYIINILKAIKEDTA